MCVEVQIRLFCHIYIYFLFYSRTFEMMHSNEMDL